MSVSITLTDTQIAGVVRKATGDADLVGLRDWAGDPGKLRELLEPFIEDADYSRSVLRSILVLASFPTDGSSLAVTAVAGELGLSPSTTHRYVKTWVLARLLERDPVSRRYRRVVPSPHASSGCRP
jgi:IclR helix-turn-helix domain